MFSLSTSPRVHGMEALGGPAGFDSGSGSGYPHLMLQAYPSVFGGRPLSALWTPSRQPAPRRTSAAHPCAPSPGGDPSSGYEDYLAGSGGVVVTPRPWRGPRHSGKHSCWQLKFRPAFNVALANHGLQRWLLQPVESFRAHYGGVPLPQEVPRLIGLQARLLIRAGTMPRPSADHSRPRLRPVSSGRDYNPLLLNYLRTP